MSRVVVVVVVVAAGSVGAGGTWKARPELPEVSRGDFTSLESTSQCGNTRARMLREMARQYTNLKSSDVH